MALAVAAAEATVDCANTADEEGWAEGGGGRRRGEEEGGERGGRREGCGAVVRVEGRRSTG